MKNIKLFMFIIPLLAGLLIADPFSINAAYDYPPITIELSFNGSPSSVHTFTYVNSNNNNRYAIYYRADYNRFILCSTTANNATLYNNTTYATFNFNYNEYYDAIISNQYMLNQFRLINTNIPIFSDHYSLINYLNNGIIVNEVDVNGNPLKEDINIPIKDIKFFNYTNLGAQYGFICNVKETETDDYKYYVNGNYKYKYFTHSVLTNIINHYGWQSEQEIYDAFKNDPQFIYKTDYNAFLQESRWYIDFTDVMYEKVQQTTGVTGVPLIYKYYGYFPTSGHCVNEIYDDIDTFTDLEYLLACFTYYPYAWKNLVYPNDTITFNWNVEDILNSHSVTIIQPDYDDNEDDDDITYTHDEDDYLGRTSDVLNYYQNEMNVESIDEASLILRNTFNCIPKDIRTIYIFFLVMASVIGLICIARE